MKIRDLIKTLETLEKELGDVDVSMTYYALGEEFIVPVCVIESVYNSEKSVSVVLIK